MKDLIDRQVILKHIEKIRQDALMMDDIRESNIIMMGMNLCEEAVKNQPSAEPRIIRCKDCKHRTDNIFGYCDVWEQHIYNSDEFFCGCGERRTDE